MCIRDSILAVHQALADLAPAMPAQIDLVSGIFHLAAAGIGKAHECAAAAEWALVGERAFYTGR